MNNFGMPIEEALALVENMLNEMTDEQVEERAEVMINNITYVFKTPEMEEAVQDFLKEVDLKGYPPQVVMNDMEMAQEALFSAITALKEKYPDSQIKQTFCDMLAGVIENYMLSVISRLSNRDSMNIGIELAHPNAKLPTYAHEGDQGADLYAVEDMIIAPHTYGNVISTGIKAAIPHDWALSIRPRSGLSKNSTLRISNSPATIDQQYRGEIKVLMDNIGDAPVAIKAGERIAQMILERNYQAMYHQVDSVDPDTERGEGGFGSSGN